MADDNLMGQDDIEQMLQQGAGSDASKKPEESAAEKPEEAAADPPVDEAPLDQNEIESLLGGGATKTEQPPASDAGEDDDKLLAQDDIEKLLNQAGKGGADEAPKPSAPAPAARAAAPAPQAGGGDAVPQQDIEFLLNQAEQALESIGTSSDDLPQGVAAFRLEDFSGAPASSENATFDLVSDVELDLKIELGRTHMYLEDVLKLRKGSVVPLDKLAGDPVDIYVNERLIARGEVLVLNDNFCVRIAELIAGTNVFA